MVRHIHPISGKDSLASALVMKARSPDLPMEYVWHDVGWELPESYEWINKVEDQLGKIHRCGRNLDEVVDEQGVLPSRLMRHCTKYGKILPMNKWIAGEPSVLYLGLRADEPDRIAGMTPVKNQSFRFPLQEMGIGLGLVWEIVTKSELRPPQYTWQWMIDRVASLGWPEKPLDMPEWEWLSIFAGRTRNNCDRCFFKRLYEWVWLYETHPDRFQAACHTEQSTQHSSEYTWLNKYKGEYKPLSSIIERAEEIKEKRARQIVQYLSKRQQTNLFDVIDDNPFGQTSCGVFCGK